MLWRQADVALIQVLVLTPGECVSQNTSQMLGRFVLYVVLT